MVDKKKGKSEREEELDNMFYALKTLMMMYPALTLGQVLESIGPTREEYIVWDGTTGKAIGEERGEIITTTNEEWIRAAIDVMEEFLRTHGGDV